MYIAATLRKQVGRAMTIEEYQRKKFGELRRFRWITKDDETKRRWLDLVEEKRLSRNDLILLLGAMGINYEQFSRVVPGCPAGLPENLPEVSQLLAHC